VAAAAGAAAVATAMLRLLEDATMRQVLRSGPLLTIVSHGSSDITHLLLRVHAHATCMPCSALPKADRAKVHRCQTMAVEAARCVGCVVTG